MSLDMVEKLYISVIVYSNGCMTSCRYSVENSTLLYLFAGVHSLIIGN